MASLNDQVVPLYSSLFSSLSHPSMLRAIFIDSQAFETSADFMTNLVVFATRLRNAGLNAHGLDFHLSEALAGSLMGVGHSSSELFRSMTYYKKRAVVLTRRFFSHAIDCSLRRASNISSRGTLCLRNEWTFAGAYSKHTRGAL